MTENSLTDIFHLYWTAILKESMYYSNTTLFTEKHCTADETRDVNFDVVENRLAYMYKFGYYNAVFIQKCLESFLDKYTEGKELFSRDLKVCSLSNGPGFDLIGFFCFIYRSFKNFKSFPVFKTINLSNSWFGMCHFIFRKVFQAAIESSNNRYSIPSEIINFVQCDIYSTLSDDAQKCIKDSDILLMMKVFASTKATSDVVVKSMEEIFSLLKPGSFVFFVGSKKITKELTTNDLLNKFVSCILGPIKISIADLPVNEAVVKRVGVKPKTSGNAYFIVWLKNDSVLFDDVPKKKRRRKKKKSNIQVEDEFIESTAVSQQIDDTDESSETLHSSPSKQSLSDDSYSTSSEKMFQPISSVKIHSPVLGKEDDSITLNNSSSVSRIVTILDKIHLDSEKGNLTAIKDITKLGEESICVPEKKFQSEEIETCLVKDAKIQSKSEDISSNEINSYKKIEDVEMILNRDSCEPKTQLIEQSNFYDKGNINPVLTHHHNKELHLIQKYPHFLEENTFICNDNNVHVDSLNKKESVQDMHFNTVVLSNDSMSKLGKIIQASENKAHMVTETDVCSASYIQKEKTSTTANHIGIQVMGLKQTGCLSSDKDVCDASNRNSINNLQGTVLRTDIQNLIDKKSLQNASMKTVEIKSKSRVQENKSVKNSPHLKINESTVRTPKINDTNKDLHLLLQRCDNLVTSLEKLTANFKNNISLSSDQDTTCCLRKSCTKCKIHHAYVSPCCFNPVHSHCCRKVYNCHMFNHNTCTACPKHSCERVKPN